MRALAAVALALGVAPGCSADTCDPTVEECDTTTDSDAYTGSMSLQQVAVSCSASTRSLDVVVEGAAASATVTLDAFDETGVQTWTERHRVPVVSADGLGWWEARWLELAIADTDQCDALADCEGRFESGVRTLFPCEDALQDDEDSDTGGDSGAPVAVEAITWTLQLTDSADRDLQSCYTWGERPDLVDGCAAWEPL